MPTAQEVRDEIERRRAQREQEQRSLRVQAAANGQSVTPEAIRRELARRAQMQAERNRPRSVVEEATQGLATLNQGLFMGLGDEVSGAIGGVIDAGGAALSGDFGGIGDAYLQGYERESGRTRQAVDDFRERRPNVAAFTEGTGAAVPVAAALIAGQPQAAAGAYGPAVTRGALTRAAQGRGAGAWAAQTAQGASAGSAYGAVYGAGADDGDWQSRLGAANEGAAYGAAFGAAAPTAVNALRGASNLARPAWEATVRAAERIPTPAPNTVGSNAGNLRGPGRSGALQRPPREEISRAAQGTIDRMAQRSNQSADDVERALTQARVNPQGQVLADVFGDTGVRTTRAIAQAPGQTGNLAAEVTRERFQAAPQRIMDALRRRLGVGQTRSQAMEALSREYDTAAAELYNPLWQREVTPEQVAVYEARLRPLIESDPILQDALARGEAIFAREQRLGMIQGDVQDNLARYMHYVKMGLDDAIGAARRNPTGAQATEMRGIQQLRRRFIEGLDEMIPGYGEARARWGGLREAEDALDRGAEFMTMLPDEIRGALQDMSPFAREHARIGFAAEVDARLASRGSVVGNRNVAEALGSPMMQQRVAALFDSPDQAAAFLDALNTNNQLMRNAGQWGTGSQTYSNAMHGADEGMNAMLDAASQAGGGNIPGAIRGAFDYTANLVTMGTMERANNQRGAALLRRIDGPEAKAFADEVIRILREREAMRAGNATASTAAAAQTGGAQASRNERN